MHQSGPAAFRPDITTFVDMVAVVSVREAFNVVLDFYFVDRILVNIIVCGLLQKMEGSFHVLDAQRNTEYSHNTRDEKLLGINLPGKGCGWSL